MSIGPPKGASSVRPPTAIPRPSSDGDWALSLHVASAERLRATVLAVFFAMVPVLGVVANLAGGPPEGTFREGPPTGAMALVSGFGLVYALGLRRRAAQLRASGEVQSRREIVTVTLIEVVLASCFMLVGANAVTVEVNMAETPAPLLFVVVIALSGMRMDWLASLVAGVGSAASILGIMAFTASVAVVDGAAPPLLTSATTIVALMFLMIGVVSAATTNRLRTTMRRALASRDERDAIFRVFGQHVSPQVVEKLMEQRKDTSELRHVCLMFLDIRDFTALAAARSPTEVVDLLNQLFAFMIEAVNDHGGIINKFLGDGFMAVFGAPLSNGRDAENAVAAAEAILTHLDAHVRAGILPPMRVGIGLHAGDAITGSVGSPRRKEYTIIGDPVNLASRIEQLNKRFNSQLLVSETVWKDLDRPPTDAVVHDEVRIRGIDRTLRIYQLA